MIGSDVVIAGMVGEQCFAYSYYLTAKEQCNYEGGQVCSLCPIHWGLTCNDHLKFYMSDEGGTQIMQATRSALEKLVDMLKIMASHQ